MVSVEDTINVYVGDTSRSADTVRFAADNLFKESTSLTLIDVLEIAFVVLCFTVAEEEQVDAVVHVDSPVSIHLLLFGSQKGKRPCNVWGKQSLWVTHGIRTHPITFLSQILSGKATTQSFVVSHGGVEVGAPVGAPVGNPVGNLVGNPVGNLVGRRVGFPGSTVGLAVGLAVGAGTWKMFILPTFV